jgi:hypothetical protein
LHDGTFGAAAGAMERFKGARVGDSGNFFFYRVPFVKVSSVMIVKATIFHFEFVGRKQ